MQNLSIEVKNLKQYFTHTKNPITVITVDKKRSQKYLIEDLKPLFKHIKILVIVDVANQNDVNNIDSNRDIYIENNTIAIDATNKNEYDNFKRRWPNDVTCSKEVLEKLKQKGIIDISSDFEKKFQL